MAKEFKGKAITSLENTLNLVGGRLIFDETKNGLSISPGESNNIAIGSGALDSLIEDISFQENIAIGQNAGQDITTGDKNVLIGKSAGIELITGTKNVAIGRSVLTDMTSGGNNVAIGDLALGKNNVDDNVALGTQSLRFKQDTSDNTDLFNCSGLGAFAAVSASNQVQLGDSSTTTFAYGAVQDRSDARDKADIEDSGLGLDFINKLRPVSFKWDMRDDYKEINDEGETVRIEKDGSKKRSRLHYGVIAQELKAVIDDVGIDFGGFQDHSKSEGGCDVLSVGYTEFIGPLIKAVQELSERISKLEK